MTEKNENFLFEGMDANDDSLSVFDKPATNQDGLYRPKLEDARDKSVGYRATLRFLPNVFEKDGKMIKGPSAIEKHVHYVKLVQSPELQGFYDCGRNYEDKCDMCTVYWKLHNSKNQADVAKAELINRTTKYYSYVMIMEDEQHPELVGKIMIFPYGYTIKEKINSERNGEVSGVPSNVFDINHGKNFKLIIKNKGDFQNYDASQFMESSPIKLYDEANKKFIAPPVDENGKISNPKVQARITKFLLERDVDMNEHAPVKWTEETRSKVSQILSVLNGDEVFVAETKSNMSKKDATTDMSKNVDEKIETTTADDFFSLEEPE